MVQEAARSAGQPAFSQERLRLKLLEIARRSFHDEAGINAAIAEGWHRAVKDSLADGVLSQEQETKLREFRDRFQIMDSSGGWRRESGSAGLNRAARDRALQEARQSALTVADDEFYLDEVEAAIDRLDLPPDQRRALLCEAWEAAVEGSLEDGTLSLGRRGGPAPVSVPLQDRVRRSGQER